MKRGVSGRVQILGLRVGRHGPPAEGYRAAPCIPDREHDPVPKPVVGRPSIVGREGKARPVDLLRWDILAAQVLDQTVPRPAGEPDLEPVERRGIKPAPVEVIASRARLGAPDLATVIPDRHVHDVGKSRRFGGLLRHGRRGFRHFHACLPRQQLDRFHELHVLCLADEVQRVALGLATEAIVIALPIIHMKRRGFFLMERAGGPVVSLAQVRLPIVPRDFPPDHGGKRKTRFQLVKESGW